MSEDKMMKDEMLHMRREDGEISGDKLDLPEVRTRKIQLRMGEFELTCGHFSSMKSAFGQWSMWCDWCYETMDKVYRYESTPEDASVGGQAPSSGVGLTREHSF